MGLDFLNFIAPTAGSPAGAAVSGEAFVAWLAMAGLADRDVLRAWHGPPGEVDAVAMRACAIGAWFRRLVLVHKGRPLPASALRDLAPLNRILETDALFTQVEVEDTPDGSRLVWRDRRPRGAPEALILPLAEAMSRLVCEEDFSLIRTCEGVGCGKLFLDRTRGRGRRWCDMTVCGNRAKQLAHRLRLASPKTGPIAAAK